MGGAAGCQAYAPATETRAPIVLEYASAMRELARERSIPVADVRTAMRALEESAAEAHGALFVDAAHPTKEGSVVFADTILRALEAAKLVPER